MVEFADFPYLLNYTRILMQNCTNYLLILLRYFSNLFQYLHIANFQ